MRNVSRQRHRCRSSRPFTGTLGYRCPPTDRSLHRYSSCAVYVHARVLRVRCCHSLYIDLLLTNVQAFVQKKLVYRSGGPVPAHRHRTVTESAASCRTQAVQLAVARGLRCPRRAPMPLFPGAHLYWSSIVRGSELHPAVHVGEVEMIFRNSSNPTKLCRA